MADGGRTAPGQIRRDRAERTRRRILDSAYRLFSADGYQTTTMATIAADAGVAVQTVHYVFRTKAQLLREVVRVVAAGEHDPLPVTDRPWWRDAMAAGDADRALAGLVEHGVDIYARMAPLTPAVRAAAAADPEVEEYWREVSAARHDAMEDLIRRLADLGALDPSLTVARGTAVLSVVNSHDTFLGLVREAGWSLPDYKAWLHRALVRLLLGGAGQSAAPSTRATDMRPDAG
jgi:AcrR family transcriptional regulator